MSDLQQLHRLIKETETELNRLHGERSQLKPGDREGASRVRTFINSTAADLEELKRDAAAIAKREQSAERTAERTAGRAALAAAQALQPKIAEQWAEFQRLVQEAARIARGLSATMQEAGNAVRVAVKSHHGQDHAGLLRQGFTLTPAAMGSTGPVAQAVAFELVELLDAVPEALNVMPVYLFVNRSSLPSGAEAKPVLVARVQQAFAAFNQRAEGLCAEPKPHEEAAA